MPDIHPFLQTLALVLGVAAVTTVLFHKLRQPVVLGYLLAGMIIGPHLSIPIFADTETVHTLAELGVILLMFSLGIDFSLRKLIKLAPTVGFITLLQCSLMLWIGYMTGRLFGWTSLESLYAGAIIAISSTTIVVKAFTEQGIKGKVTDIVFGILIAEDLIAVLLLTLLTMISSGTDISAVKIAEATLTLVAFLIGILSIGILVIPRLMRVITGLNRPETTLVASVGICFGFAFLAQSFGYSVALGAFVAGALIAESGEEHRISQLIEPVRDMFGAIFFVAVGMLINPSLIVQHWEAVLIFTLVVIFGKVISVAVGTFLMGYGTRLSIQSGMSLAQIGEFSFIIAGLGLTSGATREFLYPVAVAVAAVTTFIKPWLIRLSIPVATYIDRKLPRSLQTFVALYGAWIGQLRAARAKPESRSRIRRLPRLLIIDVVLLIFLVAATSLALPTLTRHLAVFVAVPEKWAQWILVAGAVALAIPLCTGIVRCARGLGTALAAQALPEVEPGQIDLAFAPRRALIVTLQLIIMLVAGLPILAATQPFLPLAYSGILFGICLIVLGIAFWRSAEKLQGHVKAGAQMIVEALTPHFHTPNVHASPTMDTLLPGLGRVTPIKLPPDSKAIGKTLSELNLRGLTGASVIAMLHAQGSVIVPTGKERLQEGDTLALAGSDEAVAAAVLELLENVSL